MSYAVIALSIVSIAINGLLWAKLKKTSLDLAEERELSYHFETTVLKGKE